MQTVDVSVRLQALDGTWETCGADRAISVDPESVQPTWNTWGPDKASFTLRRSPIAIWPDLGAFTPVEIEIGGVTIWKGRVGETPLKDGAERSINVECEGNQYQLDDDVYQRAYVHARLGDWKDARSFATADLAHATVNGNVQTAHASIVLGWGNGATVLTGTTAAVILDLGPNGLAKRVVVEWENAGFAAASGYSLFVKTLQDPSELISGGENIVAEIDPATGTSPQAGTATTAQRYVAVLIYRAGGTVTEAADRLVKIKAIRTFADTAYESGGTSALLASTIVKDALSRATMLLSTDTSQIAATSFNLPEFVLSKLSTPRQVIEAANAYHNWVARLDLLDRLVFAARPAAPGIEIGAWAGSETEDASANSGAEIYNRAVVEAQEADSTPLVVERTAAQQAGAQQVAITSPAPTNPSFATNTEGWSTELGGTIARETTAANYRTAPASGKWVPTGKSNKLIAAFTGTFHAHETYVLTFWLKGPGTIEPIIRFGTTTDQVAITPVELVNNVFTAYTVAWTPQEDHASGVTLQLSHLSGTFYIDDLSLTVVAPTIVDRRSFRRTKIITTTSAITPVEGQQLADTFLKAHTTTPFKGSAKISPGGVRRVLSGRPLHPSQVGLHVNELIRLSDHIDPDTGAVGRDGTIAEVAYDHASQTATVSLDDQRGNFDALLARLQIVQEAAS